MQPLLSICVPTYNNAKLLRVSLPSIVSQTVRYPDLVEVCVSDNASPDDTMAAAQEASAHGPLRYSRNETNVGFHGNVIGVTTKQATGEFVWLIGDDELMMPGILDHVLPLLSRLRALDAFYINYRCAVYPAQWPTSAIGGHDGPYEYVFNPDTSDRPLRQWKELLTADSWLCTQMFAHITKRSAWVECWKHRPFPKDNTVEALYAHNIVYGDMLMNRPAYYIGRPGVTGFGGWGKSWINRVLSIYHSRLFHFYRKKGLSGEQLRACQRATFEQTMPYLSGLLADDSRSSIRDAMAFMSTGWRYPEAWKTLAQAIRHSNRPKFLSTVLGQVGRAGKKLGLLKPWGV